MVNGRHCRGAIPAHGNGVQVFNSQLVGEQVYVVCYCRHLGFHFQGGVLLLSEHWVATTQSGHTPFGCYDTLSAACKS
jgi:hypothetical protein